MCFKHELIIFMSPFRGGMLLLDNYNSALKCLGERGKATIVVLIKNA